MSDSQPEKVWSGTPIDKIMAVTGPTAKKVPEFITNRDRRGLTATEYATFAGFLTVQRVEATLMQAAGQEEGPSKTQQMLDLLLELTAMVRQQAEEIAALRTSSDQMHDRLDQLIEAATGSAD